MASIRHFSLGCCLLCAMAGLVRIFWPENGFKPVINTVLLLYIIASALPMAQNTDWQALGTQLRSWTQSEANTADYSGYALELGRQAAQAALQKELGERGIEARVAIGEAGCTLYIAQDADSDQALRIARLYCGTMPCTAVSEPQKEDGQP